MNNKTNLQVPISLSLKNQAEKVAKDQGFSSLQELVRVFISNFSKGNISVIFGSELSQEARKRYEEDLEKTRKALKTGDIKIHDSAEDAIKHLR